MKFWLGTPGWGWRLWGVSSGDKWFIGLSVKQGASHDSENVAEIEALRAEVARLEVIAGYGGVSSDAPERLILASEVYDGVQSCDKWCDVRRVVDDGQPMPESATAYVRADRAERLEAEVERVTCELMDATTRADKLAEALRELVEVFSESGMYDEEVFDKARAALDQEDDQ